MWHVVEDSTTKADTRTLCSKSISSYLTTGICFKILIESNGIIFLSEIYFWVYLIISRFFLYILKLIQNTYFNGNLKLCQGQSHLVYFLLPHEKLGTFKPCSTTSYLTKNLNMGNSLKTCVNGKSMIF